jgi:hypothetical protein
MHAIRRSELTQASASASDVLGARWSHRIQGLSFNLVGFVAVLQPSSDVSARVHAEHDIQTIVLLSLSSVWTVQLDSRHVTAGPRIKAGCEHGKIKEEFDSSSIIQRAYSASKNASGIIIAPTARQLPWLPATLVTYSTN